LPFAKVFHELLQLIFVPGIVQIYIKISHSINSLLQQDKLCAAQKPEQQQPAG